MWGIKMAQDDLTNMLSDVGSGAVKGAFKSIAKIPSLFSSAPVTMGSEGASLAAAEAAANMTMGGEAASLAAAEAASTAGGLSLGPAIGGGIFGALALHNAMKIYQSFTEDRPAIDFIGGNVEYIPRGTVNYDSERAGSRGTYDTYVTSIKPGDYKSNAGFNYSIGLENLDGSIGEGLRDYIDKGLQAIQDSTNVDINQLIPNAFEIANIKEGESPLGMANRVLNKVQASVQSGTEVAPYYLDKKPSYGGVLSGVEWRNYLQDARQYKIDNSSKQIGTRNETLSTISDKDIEREYSGLGKYRKPIFTDLNTFEGDANYAMIDFSEIPQGGNSSPQLDSNQAKTNISTMPGGETVNGTPSASTDLNPNGVTMPSNIPNSLQPGLTDFVNNSQSIADRYDAQADSLWEDYLDFETTYFDKYEASQDQYQSNLSNIPKMNFQMPDSMGGATMPLAPKVHSAMYTDQFNAMNNSIGNQANTTLAGLGSRDALAKNQFTVGNTNLTNSFMPTQTAIDLYKMERAGQLGINQTEAGKYEPSTVSTWAPVVGSILKSDFATGALSSGWDFLKDGVSDVFDYFT
jgi:hypothetical protein